MNRIKRAYQILLARQMGEAFPLRERIAYAIDALRDARYAWCDAYSYNPFTDRSICGHNGMHDPHVYRMKGIFG